MLPHDQRGTRERSQRDGFAFAVTIGELYLFPIGLSLVSKIAPARMISTMMGLWLGTSFVGNFVAGWLGSFWSSMEKMSFFIMIAAVTASAGIVIWSFHRPLKGILHC
jgi:POT family proton-dependent oligopeptide transporter